MRNDIVRQTQLHQRDKANGVKHTPLHTLQECCEEADITPSWFGRYAAQDPDAPQPVLQHGKTLWRAGKKYYRKHEFVQWVNQVRKQKEKAMPDIKSALEKALAKTANAWAADDEAHQQIQSQQEKTMTATATPEKTDGRIKNNVSRITFNLIRDNPGLTIDQVVGLLRVQGFKETSVSSLCYQMLRVRLVTADADGKLRAVVNDYVPIPSRIVRSKKSKAAPTQPRKQVTIVNTRTGEVINPKPSAGISALPTKAAPTPVEKPWEPSDVIDKLTVHQALALFKELRNILVG
jgi:hypothetical protein